ncbi:MAG: hypothetical protein CMA31_05835 [Euryarchaeota archaeon]|nr:hypothetical protein [Euryarchaeota archaeon]RPG72702.1 MAG: ArsR family transcriptional regulator [Euryarchaeota archaeon TMED192]
MAEIISPNSEDKPRRIRGLHRRRVLFALSRSDLTVAQISRQTGLRMPHVSAELKRLRNEGMVSSTADPGTRGSSIYLTHRGREAIMLDEAHRVQSCKPIPPSSNAVCMVSRDRDQLLLASTLPFDQASIAVPDRPLPITDSSGNEGVIWILAEVENKIRRWINPHTGKLCAAPSASGDPNKIESFSEVNRPLCIFHARIIESGRPISITPGTWFTPRFDLAIHPFSSYSEYSIRLGTIHPNSTPVFSPEILVVDIEGRMGKSLISRITPDEFVTIGRIQDNKNHQSVFPLEVLDNWIRLAHPRTNPSELRRRTQALKDRILFRRRSRVPEETLRRFRLDWGDSLFEIKEINDIRLNTSNLGVRARHSLIEWAIQTNAQIPMRVEIEEDLPEYLIHDCMRHLDRGIIQIDPSVNIPGVARLSADSTRPLPWTRYSDPAGLSSPVRIDDGKRNRFPTTQIDEIGPIQSKLEVQLDSSESSDPIILESISEMLGQNEDWANSIEAEHPEASLIATPPGLRWHRWKRIGDRVHIKWLAMIRLEDMPEYEVHELMNQTTPDLQTAYSEQFSQIISENPNFAFDVRPMTPAEFSSRGSSWVASRLLTFANHLSRDMIEDLKSWAIPAWLQNPPEISVDTLSAAMKVQGLENLDEFFNEVHKSAIGHPNSDLSTWSRFVRITQGRGRLTPSFSSLVIQHLPMEWYAPLSEQLLLNIIKMEDWWNQPKLSSIPWAALILRPKGEYHSLPGTEGLEHPGQSNDLLRRLEDAIQSEMGLEALEDLQLIHISDLLMALEKASSGSPPVDGKSHKMVGWLAQPFDKWPDMAHIETMQGNSMVMARLLIGRSRYAIDTRPGS